jgi:glucuronate isomerase
MNNLPECFFSSDPSIRELACNLYNRVAELPIVSPHGHVEPGLLSNPNARFGSPAELLVIPDHYITRMLFSHGISLDSLGMPQGNGENRRSDHRRIWRIFCENFFLFRATPSGIWLRLELQNVFGIEEKPTAQNADYLYDLIADKLESLEFSPRALFERFKIELLSTTDAATDSLEDHQAIRTSGWKGRVLPTFRPDGVINLNDPDWRANIDKLSKVSGILVTDFHSFIRALEQRREFFKSMGALASDHGVLAPTTLELSQLEIDQIFQRALRNDRLPNDAQRFTAHMLMEMARMSCEDGLVMQLHAGSWRNYDQMIYKDYGADKGADIPIQVELTRNLLPLLNKFGRDPRLTLIIFTLDESAYSRELAPLAGFYPAMKLGPPWWFHDSLNGMSRYFDQVIDTAGLYNTVGFNDDTRAFCSIPARHEVWRRASANWVAGLAARRIIDWEDAEAMMFDLAVGLARQTYRV